MGCCCFFSNGEIAEGRHKVAVSIMHSNLANWLTNIKAECKRRAWSAHLSQLHTVCPFQLSITLKCTEAEDWDVIEGDINGKLCLWHWWEACPLLACELRAVLTPECTGLSEICETRAECRRSNITSASMTVPMSCVRKIQCVQVYRFVFFSLSPPTNFFSGSQEAADYPSMHQAEGREVITGFQTHSADAHSYLRAI